MQTFVTCLRRLGHWMNATELLALAFGTYLLMGSAPAADVPNAICTVKTCPSCNNFPGGYCVFRPHANFNGCVTNGPGCNFRVPYTPITCMGDNWNYGDCNNRGGTPAGTQCSNTEPECA
jgi:hypothetical protein